jgi:phage terminase large subunit-like protein
MDSEYRVTPIYTEVDKLTRAWKLSPLFENKKMFFRKGLNDLIDQLVLFPNHPLKDLWDALDLAVRTRRRRKRKRRDSEPGLI